jgi:hypothetical protein
MSRQTKEERLAALHAEFMLEFDEIQAAVRDERLQCLEDRRFYSIAGAQWEGALGEQFENKPKLEVNKIHLAVIRIFNEYRNNRISVSFLPKDGTKNDQLSDACNGLYRAGSQDSSAEEAKDNAFDEAVGGGFGAWRLRAVYEDEEDEDGDTQNIIREPIYDADSSVFFSLNAKRYDKRDATRCYVLTSYTDNAFEDEFESDPSSWPKSIYQFDWASPGTNVVFVAEVYDVETVSETLHVFRGLQDEKKRIWEKDLTDELLNELEATGFKESFKKKIKKKKVHKYLASGNKIESDEGYIAGNRIPIVPMYGKRWYVNNIERCMGHVRLAKDAQRLKNMQLSKLAELSALSATEKPIVTPEQIKGHEYTWANDSIQNYSYLPLNREFDMNGNPIAVPMEYTRVPNIPPAMAALLQITEQDMQDLLGNQQAGEQVRANVSAEAIDLVQNKLDMQAFIYMSNMAKSEKCDGEIWLGMAKDIFIQQGRKLKTMDEQGEPGNVELLKPTLGEDGAVEGEVDFSRAKLDVAVSVGPSSSSQRNMMVKTLLNVMQVAQDPETIQVVGSMIMMNLEGEGLSDFRNYFRQKLIRIGAVKPTDEEVQELQAEQANKQPDPQAEFLKASAEQAQAEAAKSQTAATLNLAKSEESQAKTKEILAGIGRDDRGQLVDHVEKLHGTFAENNPQTAPTAPSQ